MKEKEFIIKITEDQANYLQRLGTEVDSKVFIIDRLFANHATDTDTQLFDSVPFQHYVKEYEKAYLEWELAKAEFKEQVLIPIVREKTGEENPNFNWIIDDFLSLECKITLV